MTPLSKPSPNSFSKRKKGTMVKGFRAQKNRDPLLIYFYCLYELSFDITVHQAAAAEIDGRRATRWDLIL